MTDRIDDAIEHRSRAGTSSPAARSPASRPSSPPAARPARSRAPASGPTAGPGERSAPTTHRQPRRQPRPVGGRSTWRTGSATSTSTDDGHHVPDPRGVQGRDRHHRGLPGGRRRQRGVLHQRPPGAARAGQPTGWDLVVLTDWMVARLARLGWLEAIDTAARRTSPPTSQDSLQGPILRPRHELRRAVAVGHDRLGYDQNEDRRADSVDCSSPTVHRQDRPT